jgi:hypothetical protein
MIPNRARAPGNSARVINTQVVLEEGSSSVGGECNRSIQDKSGSCRLRFDTAQVEGYLTDNFGYELTPSGHFQPKGLNAA